MQRLKANLPNIAEEGGFREKIAFVKLVKTLSEGRDG